MRGGGAAAADRSRSPHPGGPVAALLGTATLFRLMHLSSVPGVSGDEGWWGIQATRVAVGPALRSPHDQRQSHRPVLSDSPRAPSCAGAAVVPAAARVAGARQPAGASGRLLVRASACTAAPRRGFTRWLSRSCRRRSRTAASARIPRSQCSGPASSSICPCSASRNAGGRGSTWAPRFCCFPVALWTHPTNVFIAPFLLLPCARSGRPLLPSSRWTTDRIRHGGAPGWRWRDRLACFTLLALVGVEYLVKPWLSMAVARLIDGAQWFEFAANNARLFNGVTVYHYFSGARPATVPYDAGRGRRRRRRRLRDSS